VSVMNTVSLWALPMNTSGVLVGFGPALSDRYRGRLQEFGFHLGEQVCCQHRTGFGAPRVYRVSNATYSLDQELAEHILVQLIESEPHA
jgi:Fe2+ transport system protein FeoA